MTAFTFSNNASYSYTVDDNKTLVVTVTPEGIIMDAYKDDEHKGTVGMTAEEWYERLNT